MVSWSEAGLGNNVSKTYTATAVGNAVYACINRGGKHPQASNKQSVSANVGAEGTFTSAKNGRITASLTIEPPDAGSFSCPGGQVELLACVGYNFIALDGTATTPEHLPGFNQLQCLLSGNLQGLCASLCVL